MDTGVPGSASQSSNRIRSIGHEMAVSKDSFDAAQIPGIREALTDTYNYLRKVEKVSFKELLDGFGNFLPGVAHTRDCPSCENSRNDAVELYRVHGMTIAQCRRCEFVYSREVINRDRDAVRYVGTPVARANLILKGNHIYQVLEEKKAQYIIERATELRGKPGKMLDVGCSTGKIIIAARTEGWDVTGIEANIDATLALTKRGFRVVNGFFPDTAPEAQGEFDLISMLDVLEHFEDPVGVLRRTRDFLSRDGTLAIQVPNFNSLLIRLEGEKNNNFCHGHWSYFTPASLDQVAKKAGFTTLVSETIISEIDKIAAYPPEEIRTALEVIAGIVIDSVSSITPDWLHHHRLGYKIFAFYQKLG